MRDMEKVLWKTTKEDTSLDRGKEEVEEVGRINIHRESKHVSWCIHLFNYHCQPLY